MELSQDSNSRYWAGYMNQALELALESPDPSTQNGAIALRTGINGKLLLTVGQGCNTFTTGNWIDLNNVPREEKYLYVEHAERMALFDAAKKGLVTDTLVCPWAACAECARAIVQFGVKTLVRLPMATDTIVGTDRWSTSIAAAEHIMQVGGVEIIEITGNYGVKLRRNGELVEF